MNVVSVSGDGYGFEVEVCGCSFPDVNPKHRRNRRISLAGAMRYVISIQWKLGCNPCRPKTKLAKAVFDRISTRLRLAGRKEKLKFFVCVGTCMDCLGVDCFFRCGNRIVTIDLYSGRRKYKGGKIKADMVLSRQHFLKDEHYKVADEIARRLAA